MTTNRRQESANQNFKAIEGGGWLSTYLPALCAGAVMTIVLLLAISCSKKSDNSRTQSTAPTRPAPEAPAPSTAANALPEKPKKAVKKHRPANATYVNGAYGVSLSYPRKYNLLAGDKQSPMPVQANFIKPGAVEIASVEMPDDLYPQTDFSSGLLNVSVNSGLTAEECGQFVPNSKDAEAAQPATVKLGANEYTELEQMNGEGERQSDLKYFHLFKNGVCYEFTLDVETSRKVDEELAQVDRGKVFQQLEKILTTARIKEVELPGLEKKDVEKAEKPAGAERQEPSAPQPLAIVRK